MRFSTASEIIAFACDIVGVQTSTIGVPGAEIPRLLKVLDGFNSDFIRSSYSKGSGVWSWMRKEIGYDIVPDTVTNQGLITEGMLIGGIFPLTYSSSVASIGSDTDQLTLTSVSGWGESGAGVLWYTGTSTSTYYTNWQGATPDRFTYTGINGSSLTGVTGISFNYTANISCQYLYKLPSDFGRLSVIPGRNAGVTISGILYPYDASIPYSNTCSLIEEDGSSYIWLPRNMTGRLYVQYDKAPTQITSETQSVDVPSEYEDYLIYKLAEHLYRTLRMGFDFETNARNIAENALKQAVSSRSTNTHVKHYLG